MAKLTTLVLFGLLALGVFASEESSEEQDGLGGPLAGLFEDKPLEDKPLLRMMMMRNLFGGGAAGGGAAAHAGPLGGPGPIARAMMSQHVPLPMMRAMMMRRMSAGQASPFAPAMAGQQQPNQLLRSLVLFRILGEKMGKKIIDELENRITDNRVYTFASSLSCNCALEYVNDDGAMAGFNFDLVEAVCKQAGKKCETVYDASSNCYTHHSGEHSRGGIGLLAKHYDGCMSWMLTSEREHSVAFTHPYWDEGNDAHFYVKAGNPKGFDPTNIQTSHIGFVDGWASDKHCLKGHRDHIIGTEHLDDPNVTEYVDAREDLFNELKDEKIDAVFMLTSLAGQTNSLGFEAIGDALKCGSGHSHVMVRKDSHVPDWFDPALDNLKTSGKYYQVCRHAKEVHGHKGDIHCMYPGEN